MTKQEIAKTIDHTVLKPEVTRDKVAQLCDEAIRYGFASVCVNPVFVRFVASKLAGSGVKTCSVVGFPLGATPTAVKAFETQQAVADGAEEIDMVISVAALKEGRVEDVEADIRGVVQAAGGRLVKVIIETCYLNDAEKRQACEAAVRAGAHFVKTSTGFGSGGATVEDVLLMRTVVGPVTGVKASGGVRTYEDAVAMLGAGATRIGTSNGVSIIEGIPAENAY